MTRIRIRGLVAAANQTRRALTGRVTPELLKHLRRNVSAAIRSTDQILAEHGATLRHLSAQSQGAYRFLKGLDLDAVSPAGPEASDPPPTPTVRFPGLRTHLVKLLDELVAASPGDLERVGTTIRGSSENIEAVLSQKGVRPQQLTVETRAIRGWLAFFSQPENLSVYASALTGAEKAFRNALVPSHTFPLPVRVHFRPLSGMFRIRGQRTRTLVSLPTPMICFDAGLQATLAGLACRRHANRRPVLEAMEAEGYQSIRADLESLGGVAERTAGARHDLAAAFDRVNRRYFGGVMSRPHLAWNDTFTRRKLGHYDFVRDAVMISTSFDRASVPEFLVDYIVYHELLHKKLGARWQNGRRMVHTPEFKRQERKFERAAEAEARLKTLVRGG
jgi:hypothetical protein